MGLLNLFKKEKPAERPAQPLPAQGVVRIVERVLPESEIQNGLSILSLVLPPQTRKVFQKAIKL